MRGNVDQAWANRLKVLRAAVRLKYSLLADNELNWRRDEEYKKFYKAVQEGKLLPPLDPKKALDAEAKQ
jgi:hypothetical protein